MTTQQVIVFLLVKITACYVFGFVFGSLITFLRKLLEQLR